MEIEDDEEISFLITNLDFIGTEFTKYPTGEMKRDKFTLKIKGYDIIFKQLEGYEKRIEQLKKDKDNGGGFTTEIIIKTPLNNYAEVKSIVDDLCWLLSFAKGVDIIASQRFHFKDGKQIWAQFENVGPRPFKRDFVIAELPPEDIVNFLMETYPNFVNYKEAFGLPTLFNLYTSMKSAFYMEIRCVTGYILLETLCSKLTEYYYLRKDPIKKNLEWTFDSLKRLLPEDHNLNCDNIEKVIKEHNKHVYHTIPDRIERIKRDFKFKSQSGDEKLFEYRKYFIHHGKFPDDVNKIELYNKLISFIDRMLLSILGYSGEYCDVTNRYQLKNMEYEL